MHLKSGRQPWRSSVRWVIAAAAVAFLLHPARAEPAAPATAGVHFDIPGLPLADALVAFGSTTGLEIFYDGSLAVGVRSKPVAGTLAPPDALKQLLAGTGYVARVADSQTFTIKRGSELPRTVAATNARLPQFQPYFALLQARIGEVLCGVDKGGEGRVIVSLWLTASGEILRAEPVASPAAPQRNEAIVRAVRGLRVGKPTPAELPQPVTMVIFTQSGADEGKCLRGAKSMGN